MNQQQYGQPPQPIHGYQGAPHPANYNGNQQPSPSVRISFFLLVIILCFMK